MSAIFGEHAGRRYRWVLGRDGPRAAIIDLSLSVRQILKEQSDG